MGLPRRVYVRMDAQQVEALRSFAHANGLALGPSVRLLVARALGAPPDRPGADANLAALVAAEHAVLMVASILPEGEQRMRALAVRATQSAEERLAFIRELPAAPEEGAR